MRQIRRGPGFDSKMYVVSPAPALHKAEVSIQEQVKVTLKLAAWISCHFSLGSTFFLMYTSEWRDRRRRQPHNVFSIQLRQNSQKKPTISGQITLFFVPIESIPSEWFDSFWILALSNMIFGSSLFKRNGLWFFLHTSWILKRNLHFLNCRYV